MNLADIEKLEDAAALINHSKHVVVLTGAGISVPSGIPDFRSQGSGLWTKNDPMQVASLTTFQTNPQAFFDWFRPLAQSITSAQPNPAHFALANLEKLGKITAIITQNIDRLHQRAGSKTVFEVHGSIRNYTCLRCAYQTDDQSSIVQEFLKNGIIPKCPRCSFVLKPSVVLFEEMLPEAAWNQAYSHCSRADLLLAIGTSLEVYPVSLLPELALYNRAKIIINTISSTPMDDRADLIINLDVAETWLYLQRVITER
jgi:NAD-dependent deacetylase